MKKGIMILWACLFSLTAFSQGIEFQQTPYAELLKLKSFGVTKVLDDDYLAAEDFAVRVADEFRGVQPLVGLLNRAVEYAREMF